MRLVPIALLAAALTSSGALAAPQVRPGGLHAALVEADPGVEAPIAARFAALDRFQAEHLPAIDPDKLQADAMADAFLAADMLAFYAQFGPVARHAHHVARMARLHASLVRRGIARHDQTRAMFDAL